MKNGKLCECRLCRLVLVRCVRKHRWLLGLVRLLIEGHHLFAYVDLRIRRTVCHL
eukprot:GAFH01001968.1.p9 GENE.GAFH01001968.1~~GAFH01001968.1.p9  ORF type:complete len:55 (+),score=0.67 GAFH01001968.1:807-971(+)